ncbi:NADP-dependent oxidoreductase [Flavobacterium ajazii]|uniref:NADP-dependent oxidoreductase n=1 Tax=Flavobacterium ajazii TaxID=2692318 RepID=UPI0013D43D04|nr:NADP-dependent oxidoreductase [Flavobacterium ajazii]
MKAIVLNKVGNSEALHIAELPSPNILPTEVLIKVKAISINPADTKLRSGGYFRELDLSSAVILGWDVSGEVVSVGNEVKNLKVGDGVFGMIGFPDLGKTYAEYVSAPANELAVKPKNVSFEQAAVSTLAALTAYQTIIVKGSIKPNDRVLIHAAAGGVGHFAVQMAKSLGAYVIGTASPANRDFVLGLGADEYVDYKGNNLEEKIKEVDFVLDTLGADNILRSLPLIKNEGKLITILHGIDDNITEKANSKNIDVSFHLVEPNNAHINAIAGLLQNKTVKPHISHNFSFEQMPDAHKQQETGRTVGKIAISVQ